MDVGLRDDRQRVLILGEIWNTIGDVGGAARDTNRKRDEVAILAGARDPAYRVATCWIVRATATNRALVAAFRMSSSRCFRAHPAGGSLR